MNDNDNLLCDDEMIVDQGDHSHANSSKYNHAQMEHEGEPKSNKLNSVLNRFIEQRQLWYESMDCHPRQRYHGY